MSTPSLTPPSSPPRLGRRLLLRSLLGIAVIACLAAATTATSVLLEVKDNVAIFRSASKPIPGIKGALDDVDGGGPQTILILGSDRRFVDISSKNPVRADTIILVRLDPDKGATAVMSIPRDLKVPIPGFGINKINAAYAFGGPALTVKTVRALLGLPINHVVNVNFGGFQRAVNRLGCVYTDVDRRYFNDNHPPFGDPTGGNYAVIDVKAGYQKLCGADALSYVRYRHLDNDLVRGARQQEFLRQAKDQIGLGKIFSDRKTLLRIFGTYTDTDISSDAAVLRLIKLGIESAKNPLQEITFPGETVGDYVEITPENLRLITRQFLDAKGTPSGRSGGDKTKTTKTTRTTTTRSSKSSRKKAAALPAGMVPASSAGEDLAVQMALKLDFPVYYPKAQLSGGSLLVDQARAYDLYDRGRHRYRAYRMVMRAPGLGQYFGLQGTSWKAPPILDNPSERRRIGGRTFELFFDGSRLRLIAWRNDKAVYWISNTLLQVIPTAQMLALARTLGRVT
jgi:LCP family protein required for cell wall assembly